jgi:putative acetyltransferase
VAAFLVQSDDPLAVDVRALLASHLDFAHEQSPPEAVYALDAEGLVGENITFFSVREDGRLLGVGALRQLDAQHAEIKSMHTVATARGRGVGRAMLGHLLQVARARGYERVSLETGTMDAFTPARTLYASAGFTLCPPFGDYQRSPYSVCMTIDLVATDPGEPSAPVVAEG